ncbi:hypothetical protein JNUCC0626_04910 [Lentzea sp. JNUCC 0626]|uniref:hypothetical protein n=1 Tax=Lentzea sp. JNUCC 0626 TaxID=3367513 RepID=UPI00374901C8
MKLRRALAGIVSLVAVVSVFAAPQASAAQCAYQRVDLPMPAGFPNGVINGSSTDNSRIVAAYHNGTAMRGLLWVNSTLRVLPPGASPSHAVVPKAVNNTSVVVGVQEASGSSQAFRYENSTYTFLQTTPNENSSALFVNDAGDVVGEVWAKPDDGRRTVVLWPRNGARKSFGEGEVDGFNAQRKILVFDRGQEQSLIIDGDTGARTAIGGREPQVLDNDRVLNHDYVEGTGEQISEWGLDGVKVGSHLGGFWAHGRNNSGTVLGDSTGQVPSLWRPSGRTEVVADKVPSMFYYSDVTDAATLIGTHYSGDNSLVPARWLWVCS